MQLALDKRGYRFIEISIEDAKSFKQGQQTMSDILTKYFKNDSTQQQDNPKYLQ